MLPGAHLLADARELALRDLEGEPWIDHDIYDSPIGQIILTACRAAGFTPRYAARLDDHRAALRLVEAGIGVTVLPRLAVAEIPDGVVARPVVRPTVLRRIVVHARQDRRRSDLIARAVAQLRDSARKVEPA
ncbi:hypothetical protein GCM10023075_77190 [Streptosporangium album]